MIKGSMNIRTMSPRDLLILLCLRKHQTTEKFTVPIQVLVKEAGISAVTLLDSLKRLQKLGYISYEKCGRINYYQILSTITADSFDFLSTDISLADKIEMAVKNAYIPGKSSEDLSGNERLYSYIEQLENKILLLEKQLQYIATELDQTRKYVSLIIGQEYTPLNLEIK